MLAASNTSVQKLHRPADPGEAPPARSDFQRSANENDRSMRAVWVRRLASGVTCEITQGQPGRGITVYVHQARFCQANITCTSG